MLNTDYLFAALLAVFLYLMIHTVLNWPGGHAVRH